MCVCVLCVQLHVKVTFHIASSKHGTTDILRLRLTMITHSIDNVHDTRSVRETSRHLLGELLPAAVQEVVEDVHGHGEDDGRVVLRRDAVQCLQVAELQE